MSLFHKKSSQPSVEPTVPVQAVVDAALESATFQSETSLEYAAPTTVGRIDERDNEVDPAVARAAAAKRKKRWMRFGVISASLLIITLSLVARGHHAAKTSLNNDVNQRFGTQTVPLNAITNGQSGLTTAGAVSVNGQLNVNNALVLSPIKQPTKGVTGQIYYDQTTKQVTFFNGTTFTSFLTADDGVQNIGGIQGSVSLGAGISNGGGKLSNSGVLSVQGQTGAVSLSGGNGIAINGTTITSTGVLALGGLNGKIQIGSGLSVTGGILQNTGVNTVTAEDIPGNNVSVKRDDSGNVTIFSSGNTTTNSNTTGRLAKFTGVQTIGDSLIGESGTVVTVNGDLSITGSLTLSSPLAVSQGGTGVSSLAANGLLVGGGAGAISSLGGGNLNDCLVSNGAGLAPSFQTCTGAGGVSSVNTQSGALTLVGTPNQIIVSTAGTTLTLSTPQDINVTSNVTFGSVTAGTFTGNGAAITGVNADQLNGQIGSFYTNSTNQTSGTLPDARLSTNVTTQGNTFNSPSQLVQLNGTGGLPALNGSLLTNLNGTAIASGTVADGRLSTNVTLQGNTFNGNNQLVQLNGSGFLPTLNASLLTNLNGTAIASGTVADARLSTNVTLQGNTFNGANQLIQLNGTGFLPAVNGSLVTSLNGTAIASGTVADTRLSGNVTLQGNTFNGASQLIQLNASSQIPAVSGALVTNLNGTNITSGTVANGRLTNGGALNVTAGTGLSGGGSVALGGSTSLSVVYGAAAGNAVQGNVTLTCAAGIGNLSGGGNNITLGIGGSCGAISIIATPSFNNVTLGNGSGTVGQLVLRDGSTANKATVSVGTLGSDQNFALPTTGGTICVLEAGNCTGGASGAVTATGTHTQNFIPKFSNAGGTQVSNSLVFDSGTAVGVGTSSPAGLFSVGASNQFQVSSAGALTAVGINGGTGLIQGTGGLTIGGTTTFSGLTSAGGQCLTTDGSGVLTLVACLSGAGGGSGGVASLNGLSGSLSINNATGTGSNITINNGKADGTTKGIAGFNATNFSDNGAGIINTIQGIATTATPTFAGLTLTAALTISNGGTGAVTAAGARGNLGAAASGGNSDITSISGLTTALTVSQGGTGANSAAGARTNLGAAASGANSDITSLSGLTTALSVGQGGTGLSSLTANQLLFAASGSSIGQLSSGTSSQCLVSNGPGLAPSFQTCTGAGGVSAVNGQSGALTVNGTANQVSVSNVGGTFTLATPQDIGTASDVSFNSINATSLLKTNGTTRVDASGNLSNIGTITTSGLITGGNGLTISSGTVTLNNLTGGSSKCLTLDGLNQVGVATCATGSGSSPTLQDVYDNSNTAPLINLSTTGKGITVQDAVSPVGGSLFAVKNNAGTTSYFAVTVAGASVTGTLSATSFSGDGSAVSNVNASLLNGNAASYYTNASNINSGTLADGRLSANVALLNASANFTGVNLQHNGNAVCDTSGNCVGTGGGAAIGGGGTLNKIPVFTGTGFSIGDSILAQNVGATTVTVGGALSVTGAVTAASFAGDGSAVSNVNASQLNGQTGTYYTNASNLSSGTVSDNRLSPNVALLNTNANFTGSNLQHNGNAVCDTSNNCVGTGSGSAVGGSGTLNKIALFTGSGFSIGDSIIAQNVGATAINITGNLAATGSVSATSFVGDGSSVTNVNAAQLNGQAGSYYTDASNLSTGTLASGRLTGNYGGVTGVGTVTSGAIDTGFGTIITGNLISTTAALQGSIVYAENGLVVNGTTTFSTLTSTGGQCLTTNSSGVLSLVPCLSGAGGGSGGVASLNGLSGSLSINNATGTGSAITINNAKADGTTKGIATFSGSYFADNGGGLISIKTGGITSNEILDGTIANVDLAGGTYTSITGTGALTTGSIGSGFGTISTTNGITTTGAISGGTLTGDGTAVTNVNAAQLGGQTGSYYTNATNLSSGTVNDSRLSPNVALLNTNANFTGNLQHNGNNVCDTSNNCVGTGSGGAVGGSGTLNKIALFTGSGFNIGDSILSQNVGATALNIAGNLSASGSVTATSFIGDGTNVSNVNASQLNGQVASFYTDASNLSTGTLSDSRLSTNVTVQGNTFNGANQLLKLNASGEIPAVSGINVTNLNASNLASGTVASGRLSGSYTGITGVGALAAGSITTGFGAISTANNITTSADIQGNNLIVTGNTTLSNLINPGGECLTTDSSGNLVLISCLSGGGGGGTGVSSLNGLSGALSLNNATGAGSNITINNAKADGSTKGIATFASGNFADNGAGVISIKTGGITTAEILDGTIANVDLAGGTYTSVTGTGTLTTGSIGTGFGSISTTNGISTTGAISGGTLAGDGSAVTNVNAAQLNGQTGSYYTNATNLSSGTVSDSRLSSNVALYGNTTSNFTGALQQNGNNVCTVAGNCTGIVGGAIGGSGTANKIALFTGSGYSIGDSILSQNGLATAITVAGDLNATGKTTLGGGADQTQVVIKANATQSASNSLILLQSSTGSELARINVTANGNIGFGYQAGISDTGTGNVFIGNNAGSSNTSASNNTAIGAQALQMTVTGAGNSGFGNGALYQNIVGYENNAFGANALRNTTANSNGAFGTATLLNNTTGSENNGFGNGTFNANTTGNDNSGFGYRSAFFNTTGNNNAAYGTYSLLNNTTGNNNLALGYSALQTNSTGSGNTAVGQGADVTTGNLQNSTAVGVHAAVSASNSLILGCVAGTNACTTTTNVGIGNSAPAGLFSVGSSSQFQVDLSGNAVTSGSLQAASLSISGNANFASLTNAGGQCLTTDASGNLTLISCLSGGGGGGTGVSSLDGLSGSLAINNTTGSGANITINNAKADGTTKGIATFASGNFADNGAGVISIKTGGITTAEILDGTITNTDLSNGAYSNITGTGALASGSIASGFGTISTTNGISTTGAISGGTLAGDGTAVTNVNATQLNGQAGSFYTNASNLNAGTLLSGRLTGSYTGVTGVGALAAGSIATGFGTISTANNIMTTATLQGANLTISGTTTLSGLTNSGNQCLTTDGSGVVSLVACLSGASGGGGGVASLNGLSGALSINNATGAGSNITINNAVADGTTKGIASFSNVNFSSASGNIGIKTGGVGSNEITDGSVANVDLATGTFNHITGTGNLNSGSIVSGFGSILTTSSIQGATVSATGALASGTAATAGSLILQDGSNHTITLVAATQTIGSSTISLPNTAGVSDEICLKITGNCIGSGGAVASTATGGGNLNYLSKFSNAGGTNITNSQLYDNGTNVGVNATTFGTNTRLTVNTNTTANNTAATQFNTGAAGNTGVVIQGSASQTADLLQIQNSTGKTFDSIDASGNLRLGIMSAPSLTSVSTSATGGSLSAGTYYYVVTAVSLSGEITPISNERTVTTTGSTSTATLTWNAVNGANYYQIYRGTSSGGENTKIERFGNITSYTDNGAAGGAGTLPGVTTAATISTNNGTGSLYATHVITNTINSAIDSSLLITTYGANASCFGGGGLAINFANAGIGCGGNPFNSSLIVAGIGSNIPVSMFQGVSGQTADLIQFKDSNSLINSSINGTGNQLTLGRISTGGTVTQGKILLSDGTNDGFGITLQTATQTVGSATISLPNTAGVNDEICLKTTGNCVGTGGAVASTATGGGNNNYVTKFSNAGGTNITNSQLYDNGTNVGVNAATGFGTGTNFTVNATTTANNSAATQFNTGSATNIGTVIQGAAGQSADLLQFQSSNGGVVAKFDSAGQLSLGTFSPPGLAVPVASATGGTLATGTYYYKITAVNTIGETFASSEQSVSVTGPTGSVSISRGTIPQATYYKIYRGTSSGNENVYFVSSTATTSFTDTGGAGTPGTPPTTNSAYAIKLLNTGQIISRSLVTSYIGSDGVSTSGLTLSSGAANQSVGIGVSGGVDNIALHVQPGQFNFTGEVIQGMSSQTGSLLQFKDNNGLINSSFNGPGNQLTLGRIANSGVVTQGQILLSDGTTDGFGITLQTATQTIGSATISLPNTAGVNDEICLKTTGNCVGQGGAVSSTATGAGNNNFLTKFSNTGGTSIVNSQLFDNGTNVGVNAASGFGTNTKFTVNSNTTVNNTAQAQFNTGGAGNVGVVIQGSASQTGALAQFQSSTGAILASIDAAGNISTATVSASTGVTSPYILGSNGLKISTNAGNTSACFAGNGLALNIQATGIGCSNSGLGAALIAAPYQFNNVVQRIQGASGQISDLLDFGIGNSGIISKFDANGNLSVGTSATSASITVRGGIVSSQLPAPTLSGTVTNVATAGTTTYRYQITANDGTGETTGSGIAITTTGNATLDTTNYNTITWTTLPGAVSYNIYRCTGAACTPVKVATVTGGYNSSYNDQNNTAGSGAIPVSNTTGGATLAGALQAGSIVTAGNVQGNTITSTTSIQGATINGTTSIGSGTAAIAGSLILQDGSNHAVTIQAATQTGSATITIPDTGGVAATVCLTTGNCTSGAGASTLQSTYVASAGGTTPEIKLNATQGAVDIQDANTSLGSSLFNIRASNSSGLGTVLFGVSSNGVINVGAGGSILINGGATGTRPASPTEGQIYYDTTTHTLLTYNGTKWIADKSNATEIVAASNSANKDGADFVGNGTNDDVAINAAIAALPAGGGSVVLLDGTYNITATVAINKANVVFIGQGANTILKRMFNDVVSSTNSGIVTVSGSSVSVSKLSLNGNKASFSSVNDNGIITTNSDDSVDQIFVTNSGGWGIAAVSNAQLRGSFTNNNVSGGATDGIYSSNSTDPVINGNVITSNGAAGVNVNNSDGAAIGNNTINSNTGWGIIGGGSKTRITSNSVKSNAGGGISTTSNGVVTANILQANTGVGIFVSGSYVSVAGNTITTTVGIGIRLNGAGSQSNVVDGNAINSSTAEGIQAVNGAFNDILSNNVLYDNGGSGAISSIYLAQAGPANAFQIINNKITDTAGTAYAIDIAAGTNNYLSGNVYSGTGATSIHDTGTGTIYANQASSTGQLVNSSTAGAAIKLQSGSTNDLLQLQDASGNVNASFNSTGNQLTLGRIAASGTVTQGKIVLGDGTTDNFGVTLQVATQTLGSSIITLPNTGGVNDEICLKTTGNCVGQGGAVSSTATGAGNNNFLTKFSNAGGTSIVNSQLFDNGTNVGVGASTGFGTGTRFTVNTNSTANNATAEQINTGSATNVGTTIQGASGQTADLMQFQNNVGVILDRISSTGSVDIGQIVTPPTLLTAVGSTTGGAKTAGTYYYKIAAVDATNGSSLLSNELNATVATGSTGSVALSWTAVTGATGYRVWWGTSAGNENVCFNSATTSITDIFATNGGCGSAPTQSTAALAHITTAGGIYGTGLNIQSSYIGSVIIGSSSSTGGSIRISTVGGNNALSIGGTGIVQVDSPGTAGGRFTILDNGNVGIGAVTPTAKLQVVNNTAAGVAQVIQGAAAQTADLLQTQNSSGIVLSRIDASGSIIVNLVPPTTPGISTLTTGGTLAAGTYYYKVTALDAGGNETTPSSEVSITTTGATSTVTLTGYAGTGVSSWRIYRGTASGSENVYYTTTGGIFTDTGAASTGGSVPTTNNAKFNQLSQSSVSLAGGNANGNSANVAIGRGAQAFGPTGSYAIGNGAIASGNNGAIALGASTSSGNISVAIGDGNVSSGIRSIAVGNSLNSTGNGSLAFGNNSTASGSNAVVIGGRASGNAVNSVTIGTATQNVYGVTNNTTGSFQFGVAGSSTSTSSLYARGGASYAGTGTVSTTSGSAIVTGSVTSFTTDFVKGDRITIGSETYTVANIASDTSLTVVSNFTTTNSAVAYTVLPAVFKLQTGSGTAFFTANDQGYIGIGNTAPTSLFSVGNTSQFQIDASGNTQTTGYIQSNNIKIGSNTATPQFTVDAGGNIVQTSSVTGGAAFTQNITATNTSGVNTNLGQLINLAGTNTTGTNNNIGIGFNNISTPGSNNTYTALAFGTGYTSLLGLANGGTPTTIINGGGVLQSLALTGTYSSALQLTSTSNTFAGNSLNLSGTTASNTATINTNTNPTNGVLVVNNSNAAASGNLLTLQNAGANKFTVDANGNVVTLGSLTSSSVTSGGGASSLAISSGSGGTSISSTGAISIGTGTATGITISRSGVNTLINGTLTSTQLITANGGATIATGNTFTNAGSTLNSALALADFPADDLTNGIGGNGNGGAAGTVDTHTSFTVNQTSGGGTRNLNIPSPTVTTAGRIIYISNIGSVSVIISSATITTGSSASFIWNGTAWTVNGSTGGASGVSIIGTFSLTAQANGASITGNTLTLAAANASNPGLISTTTQSFGGAKTFSGGASIANSSSNAFTVANAASANIFFNVDTTSTGTITFGDTTSGNYASFTAAGGLVANGTAQHVKNITLPAEYAGAVLDSSSDASCSTANSGIISSGYDSSAARQNYYQWTPSVAGTQCYDVIVQVPLPADWAGWTGTPTLSVYNSAGTNSTSVYVQAIGSNGTTDTSYGSYLGLSSGTTMGATNLTAFDGTNYSAGGYMTLKIRLSAGSTSTNVRIGNLNIPYKSKF